MRSKPLNRFVKSAFLLAASILMIAPFVWALSTSFKLPGDVFAYPPRFLPDPVTLANFQTVITKIPFPRYLINSTIVTGTIGALNVIFGTAAAYDLSCEERPATVARLGRLRDRLAKAVLAVAGTEMTGHPKDRLPGHLSIIARDTDGSSVALSLDLEGIATSVGSACTTGSTEVSHVLTAMGYPEEEARGALRLSLGRTTTEEEIAVASEVVPRVVASMRVGAAPVAADPLGQGVPA